MAKISAITMPMMLAVACIAILVPTGLVHGLLPPLQDAGKGWSSLTKIPSCLWQICDSLSSGLASKINPACCSSINQRFLNHSPVTTGQINGIGPACCKAVTEISDKCWPKMFPFNPFFLHC
ncbi:hypothetical protein CISIN_1g045683mg [Citrus sinensis]|uniref:Prolamin-like domain-containing protein n=1 Tax=Citrus sinensis TaxID=2711 RepID=A0A067G1T4_CITSI|nr:hypothetical protein CISIN_1g045683mg [Citrus sinensis]